ncbi:hypothetical protein Ahy_B02g059738 [Arachis hypogaea]|uniref:Protein FAR1-RELATED SEQUENCE n=1 Tax=Arachis hypogaea TaxID=3818 RepID=A0A445AH52_ARAHY|nr:hypothetical protein Ahy_B02g059738 [Arachis hypogaea]
MIEYDMEDNFWAKETYDKRTMWANKYLRGKFCARFWTTSKCEGINSHVKKLLRHKEEIEAVVAVKFVRKIRHCTPMVYTLEEYNGLGRHSVVLYDRVQNKVECPYQFWKRKGYPCRLMFFVMKHEHLKEIPEWDEELANKEFSGVDIRDPMKVKTKRAP